MKRTTNDRRTRKPSRPPPQTHREAVGIAQKQTKTENIEKMERSLAVSGDTCMGVQASRTITHHQKIVTMTHKKARCPIYPRTEKDPNPIKRIEVPDAKVPWDKEFPGYNPPDYTAESVKKNINIWADVDIPLQHKQNQNTGQQQPESRFMWNEVDNNLDRTSFTGIYQIDPESKRPRNPVGRTGLQGRGLLGRWGPNHAADPIVTRWKRIQNTVVKKNGKKVLQFIAVRRRDNGEMAIPGGMVETGEKVTTTISREFREEALNSLEASPEEKKEILKAVKKVFENGKVIYQGYVDDPRNTDNAWMETVAMNFHDETGEGVALFNLKAGDDAAAVEWMDISSDLNLFASHIEFIHETAVRLEAYWGSEDSK